MHTSFVKKILKVGKSIPGLAVLIVGLPGFFIASALVAHADNVSVNFEPPAYATGSISGQQGWSNAVSPSIDQSVTSTAVSGFGAQAFQISNAYADGAFGDWVFAPPVTNAAGEADSTDGTFSAGTLQPQFDMQFDIASADPTEQQTGLQVSVAPDRGDGSRMSYLRFEDGTGGINVFFDDVEGTSNPANFVETQIATGLDRTVPHHVELTLDEYNGPSNDVVKVYIDGKLVHIGTSWENYYRYDSEASAEQSPRIVKTMIIQARNDAAPNTIGKGYLFDNISLTSGPIPTPAVNTVVVNQNDLSTTGTDGQWYFFDDVANAINNSLGSFVTGPGTPPLGVGSAQITDPIQTSTPVNMQARPNLAISAYGGIPLSSISQLAFSTYNPSAGNGEGAGSQRSGYLQFNVDFTGSNTYQNRLVYVPRQNGTVTQDTWKQWDAIDNGNALWNFSGSTWPVTAVGPDAGLTGISGTTLRTWDNILLDYPNIQTLALYPFIGVRVGEPYASGYTENIDDFVIATSSAVTQYDFDPAPVVVATSTTVTIVKYIDGAMANASSANSLAFPMVSSWTAANLGGGAPGSGAYDLGTDDGYSATTAAMATGASYATNEVTGGAVVGADCTTGDPYALVGYSTGTSLAAAASSSVSATAPSFTNLSSSEYVVVWNATCPPVPTYTVTIDKFIDGRMANATSATGVAFPMIASWNATNIGAGTGTYPLSTVGFNSPNAYEAITAQMTSGASYTTNEDTTGAIVGAGCSAGDPFTLTGYSTGPSLAAAASGTVSLTVPNFTNLAANENVVVWNNYCLPAPTLLSPLSGTATTTAGLTDVDWNSVTDPAGGIAYIYQSSNSSTTNPDGSFTSPAYTSGKLGATFILTPGTPPGIYYWHVMAIDADGNVSPWSVMWTFTVTNTGTLVVNKDTIGGDGTFTFTGNNGLGAFSITTASGTGNMTFNNVIPGMYTITETNIPKGWTQTDSDCTSVVVTAGGVDACTITDTMNTKLGEIRGTKFVDEDGDGTLMDGDHHRLAGVTIYLDSNNNGVLDPGEPSMVTDKFGDYHFSNLPAGTYHVREAVQPGWIETVPSSGSFTIVLGAGKISKNNNFGDFQLGSISGMKFNDLNGNGHKDKNEPGIAGWTIVLTKLHSTFSTSTVTDANGNYSFANLGPGTYQVREVAKTGWYETTQNPPNITLYSGANSKNDNFGNHFGKVITYHWFDWYSGVSW